MKYKIKGHGFIAPIIKPDDYLLGALEKLKGFPNVVIRKDGQWDEFLPVREYQKKDGVETMGCTGWGTLNALETLHKALYGVEPNYSDRYINNIAGTHRGGNSPQKIAETIRKIAGCIPEKAMPFVDVKSWADFYKYRPMPQQYLRIGKQWMTDYDFGHEYVPTNPASMMKALLYSPLGISVRAWKIRNGLFYKHPGEADNHWCMCYGFVKGKYWKIFDSYDNTRKKLEWGYAFRYSKRYYIKKKLIKEINMTKEELNKTYQEILMRDSDAGSKGYLTHDEDFVKEQLLKSKERKKMENWVNFLRNFKLLGRGK